jgi:hypothetical protein
MRKGDTWKLLLNHTTPTGRRLIFTNTNRRYLIDITVKPILANRIVDEVLENKFNKDELIAYLNTMSGTTIDNDSQSC